jgi:hypothetical protein
MAPPDWLSRRNGALRLASDGRTWVLYFDGAPQYKLVPTPADGRFSCVLAQMDNGKRIDKGALCASADDALRGGLDELRAFLGW